MISQMKEVSKLNFLTILAFKRWTFSDDNIKVMHQDMIVTKSMRIEILQLKDEGYLGITKCISHTRSLIFLPGINRSLEELIGKHDICQTTRRSQKILPVVPI